MSGAVRRRRVLFAGFAALASTSAEAGAWPRPKGETEAILKLEAVRAVEGFDLDGLPAPLPAEREERRLSLYVEHGLTDRITLTAKLAAESGRDAFVDYDGRGPTELGVRARLFERKGAVVSASAAWVLPGEGRNAGYAAPGEGEGDLDARVLVGRSGRWLGRSGFVEVQAVRVFRRDLPDETRLESTMGIDLTRRWTVMAQTFAGAADGDGGPAWANTEVSVLRRIGEHWRVQVGWLAPVSGRETPAASGPVVAVWRSF